MHFWLFDRCYGVFLQLCMQPVGCITNTCCSGKKGGGVRAGSLALVTCGARGPRRAVFSGGETA